MLILAANTNTLLSIGRECSGSSSRINLRNVNFYECSLVSYRFASVCLLILLLL